MATFIQRSSKICSFHDWHICLGLLRRSDEHELDKTWWKERSWGQGHSELLTEFLSVSFTVDWHLIVIKADCHLPVQ